MTAKTECIGNGNLNISLLRLVKGEVQCIVNLRILVALLMIDGGGTIPFFIASTVSIASMAPAAPSR